MRRARLMGVLAWCAGSLLIADPGAHSVDAEEARSAVEAIVAETEVPALGAALADAEGVLFADASGVRVARGSSEVGDDEPFHIGSCTKAMTATVIAVLVEDGLLRWDMTLAEALPDIAPEMHEAYTPVTLAQLLRHRAGVPSFTRSVATESALLKDIAGTAPEQRAELARRILTIDPPTAVGEYSYSNGGYGIASAIAERATGEAWEDLMRERLFAPLEMTTAGFGWPSTKERPDAPRGHYGDPRLKHRPQALTDKYELPTPLDAAGDVYCSSADLAKFARLHLRGLLGEDTLIEAATVAELHRPDGDYAAGWAVWESNGVRLSSHDGSAGTFYTRVTIRPDLGLAVVASSNSGAGMEACARACDELLALVTTKE